MGNDNLILTKHYTLLVVSIPSAIVIKIDILKKRVENRDTAGNSSFKRVIFNKYHRLFTTQIEFENILFPHGYHSIMSRPIQPCTLTQGPLRGNKTKPE